MSMKLYVSTDSWCETTREPDTDDSWDRGSTYTSISVDKISTEKIGEEIQTDEDISIGDTVYIVWAHWGSGDSFGSNYGAYSEFYLVTKDEKRADRLRDLLANTPNNRYSPIEFEGFSFYRPWFGYFESLQGVNINVRVVE